MKTRQEILKNFLTVFLEIFYCLLLMIGCYLSAPLYEAFAVEMQTVNNSSSDNPESVSDIPWEFRFVPLYVWLADMNGSVESGNVGLKDYFNDFEPGYTGHIEMVYDEKAGYILDFCKMNFGEQRDYRNQRYDVDLNNSMTELIMFSRLWKQPASFDFLIGLRFMDVTLDMKIDGDPTINRNEDWTDLIIGGRINWDLYQKKWIFTFRYDIGGYGWWKTSDLCWNMSGLINWQPMENFGLVGGYKAMGVNYRDKWGSDWFRYDVTLHGPVLGLNFIW